MGLDAVLDVMRSGLLGGSIATPAREAELERVLVERFGIRFPKKAVCPGHVSPWSVFCDAYFARHRVIVVKASRLFGGKSYLLAALGVVEAATLGANVAVLGGSGAQSRRVLAYMHQFWNHPAAPRELLKGEPGRIETHLKGGTVIEALMASQTSARGGHPQRLRLDEVDELNLEVFDAATGQAFSQGGITAQTVISSTHHNPDGTMTEVLKRAGEKGWRVCEWCYKETREPHGWLPKAEVRAKRLEMSAATWESEVELQEPSPEGRAIMTQAVDYYFNPSLGMYAGENGEYLEFEAPKAGRRYAHGADWAKMRDWTIITTIRYDCSPAKVVAWERCGRMDWPKMLDRLDQRIKRYGGAGAHDATGMDVIGDMLTTKPEGVQLLGRIRSEIFTAYIAAIERKEIVSARIEFAYREHRFCTYGDLTGAGHPPDSFVAGALAWHVVTQAPNTKATPFGVGTGRSYWR